MPVRRRRPALIAAMLASLTAAGVHAQTQGPQPRTHGGGGCYFDVHRTERRGPQGRAWMEAVLVGAGQDCGAVEPVRWSSSNTHLVVVAVSDGKQGYGAPRKTCLSCPPPTFLAYVMGINGMYQVTVRSGSVWGQGIIVLPGDGDPISPRSENP